MKREATLSDLSYAVLRRALTLARRWERRKYVLGTALGQRQRGSKYHATAVELCVVVFVDRKVLPPALRAERRGAFPRSIQVRHGGRTYHVPVDVQETGPDAGELQGLVASSISIAGHPVGAVGALVANDRGEPMIVLAGHVARRAGRRLQLSGGLTAVTRFVRMTRVLDHALAQAAAPQDDSAAALLTGDALLGVRAIDARLVGELAFFHRPGNGERVTTLVRDVDASAPFLMPYSLTPVLMRGMVSTRGDTRLGESGTLLYDAHFQAIGTLVGVRADKSFFVPCDTAFARLKLRLLGT